LIRPSPNVVGVVGAAAEAVEEVEAVVAPASRGEGAHAFNLLLGSRSPLPGSRSLLLVLRSQRHERRNLESLSRLPELRLHRRLPAPA
jgi:hypothetical protein